MAGAAHSVSLTQLPRTAGEETNSLLDNELGRTHVHFSRGGKRLSGSGWAAGELQVSSVKLTHGAVTTRVKSKMAHREQPLEDSWVFGFWGFSHVPS